MARKAVILGGTGFFGAAIEKYLKENSDFEVMGYGSAGLDLAHPDSPDQLAEVVDGDTVLIVSIRSPRLADGSIPLFSSDISLAAIKVFEKDILITTNVAKGISKQPAQKLIYFSTTQVYGEPVANFLISEETPISPSSLYGVEKFTSENLLKKVDESVGIPTTILRPCLIFGPNGTYRPYGPEQFIYSIVTEQVVRLYGDGSELRNYIYIDDLAAITSRFILEDHPGVYNLVPNRSHSFQEMVELLKKISDREFAVISEPRSREKSDQEYDDSKLQKAIGGYRFRDFEAALRDTFQFYREHHS